MIANAYSRFLLLTLPLLLIQGVIASAQGVVFSASVNASKVGVADQVEVTYTIQDAQDLQTVSPPLFKDFEVLAGPFQKQSMNSQIVGNRVIQSVSYSITFVLKAKKPGNYTIPAATAKDAAGHVYKSNTVQLQAVQGSLAGQRRMGAMNPVEEEDPFAALRRHQMMMQRMFQQQQQGQLQQMQPQRQRSAPTARADVSKDLFIKVDVDKKQVKLGEQVTAVYKLYARLPMHVGISRLPSLNGFWTQDFDIPKNPKPFEEVVNGKKYQVFVLKKSALFPQQTGPLTLDAAEAEGTARVLVQAQRNSSPFDDDPLLQAFGGSLMMGDPFFDDPFQGAGYQDIPVHLKSAPVTIQVTDLPQAGKPDDYTGAVGKFVLNSKIDKTSLSTDDVATLTLTISGQGNLKLFDAPKLTVPEGVDSYEPHILDTITGRTTTITGSKVVSYTIAPHRTGEYEIPPLTLSWFDISTGSYKSASTPAYKIHVKQGRGVAASAVAKGGKYDIKDHIIAPAPKPLIFSPIYWSMYALPLLTLVGVSFYRRKEDEMLADTAQLRNRRANKIAQKRLAAAGVLLQTGNQRGFYDEISKAIWLYLSDKLAIPISSLGKNAAAQAMVQRGIPGTIQQQIDKVLSECEIALYTPGNGPQQMQQTFSEAACIITGLERTLRS